jgi:hypothetical protein
MADARPLARRQESTPSKQADEGGTGCGGGTTAAGTSEELMAGLKKMQQQMDRIEKHLAAPAAGASYTSEEAARELGKAEWTVRQWCNKGQAQARKIHGRGRTGEWRLLHEEVVRLRNEGPLPPGTFHNHNRTVASHCRDADSLTHRPS